MYINESEGYNAHTCTLVCTLGELNDVLVICFNILSEIHVVYVKEHVQKCRFGTIGACSYLLGKGQF